MRFHFGDFVLDEATRELLHSGRAARLSPKAYELLRLLLQRRPAVVPRAELLDHLWPDTAVGYTSLPRVVAELRRTLGDRTRAPCFLRTVHGFGYSFSGPARVEPQPVGSESVCALASGGRELGLPEGETLIGRGEDCGLRIDSGRVSRHHARLVVRQRQALLEDLASKNGTFLNGQRLRSHTPTSLHDGDEIVIGTTLLVFHERYGPGPTLSA